MTPVPKFDDKTRYWLSGKKLNEIMRAIQERTPIAGPGLLSKTVPQGLIFTTDAAAAGECMFIGDVVGLDFVFKTAGTLNALAPTNLFDSGALVALPITLPAWVVLNVTTADNMVQSCELDVVAPTPDPIGQGEGVAPGEFVIPLYYCSSAGTHRLIGCGALWATPFEVMRTSNPSPDPCGDPYIRHYTWRVAS
jgi:hypothetical protein